MANLENIIVSASQNPAVVKVGPWQTFEVFHADGALHSYMDIPTDGITKSVVGGEDDCYPLTIKFKQHDAPPVPEAAPSTIPENATEVN